MDLEQRTRDLEGWRRDVARELRDIEEWQRTVKPFLEQLQADLVYRQRRHAESAHNFSTAAKVTAAGTAIVVALSALASFVLQVVHAVHG